MEYDVIVIGGGAAGMMAAIATAGNGSAVLLLEKNDRLGKKMAITGNGRCNITHACDVPDLLEKVVANPHFLYSAFYGLPPDDLIAFFNGLGLQTKVEEDGRVFPISDKSEDVIGTLERHLRDIGGQIRFNTIVENITYAGNLFHVQVNDCILKSKKCIVATGGLSHPATGSTGDGLIFAKNFGHKIVPTKPSLSPLVCAENWVSDIMGLSLKDIHLTAYANNRKVFSGIGEMIFTHYGISGPLVLSTSAYLAGQNNTKVQIDLMPDTSKDGLDARILQEFNKNPNRDLKNSLDGFVPKKLAPVIISLAGIDYDKKINVITKDERAKLVAQIKSLELTITGNRGYKEAVITAGGVNTKEIDPSTMESKIIPHLYFAGEVIDVHALTGGYNLHIAFSTGYLAGKSALIDLF
ncbi:MAG: NAD(P)/FAD-dependent oxidoreductase [Defluviitaleaceae bacterium]|nr:NAD(P)/FAD-dependent oxidoreductase [Defluviitaleaceae bacterium]